MQPLGDHRFWAAFPGARLLLDVKRGGWTFIADLGTRIEPESATVTCCSTSNVLAVAASRTFADERVRVWAETYARLDLPEPELAELAGDTGLVVNLSRRLSTPASSSAARNTTSSSPSSPACPSAGARDRPRTTRRRASRPRASGPLDSPDDFGHTCLVPFAWSSADAEVYRAGDSVAWVWNPRPRFLVTRVHGPGTLAVLQLYTARAEREILRGRLTVFHDWSDMQSYEPDARDELKRWGKLHGRDFDSVHYLVRSKVVAMLISVAALSLGRDLHATTDRPQFLADLDRALA